MRLFYHRKLYERRVICISFHRDCWISILRDPGEQAGIVTGERESNPVALLEHNGGGLEADSELRDLARDEGGGVCGFEGVVGAEDSVRRLFAGDFAG